jgi:hypothetical protein
MVVRPFVRKVSETDALLGSLPEMLQYFNDFWAPLHHRLLARTLSQAASAEEEAWGPPVGSIKVLGPWELRVDPGACGAESSTDILSDLESSGGASTSY